MEIKILYPNQGQSWIGQFALEVGRVSVKLVTGENEIIVTKSREKLVWSLCFGGGVVSLLD